MLRIKLEKLNGEIGLMCEDTIGIISTPCQSMGQLREIYQRELARGADLSFYYPGKKLFVMENEKDRIGGTIERLILPVITVCCSEDNTGRQLISCSDITVRFVKAGQMFTG